MSERIHSRYQRFLSDPAIGGRQTLICLRARRLFCPNSTCPRMTFAEQVSGLTAPHGRRSLLLRGVLETIALALGGRPGARMTRQLAIEVSRMTLLRLIRALPMPEPGILSAVGVDDFAFRKAIWSHTRSVLHVQHEWVGCRELRDGGGYLQPSITQNSRRSRACSADRVTDDAAGFMDRTR